MRPFWSGSLSFGLVNIPVNVYKATEAHTVDLDLLHKKDLSRIRYKKVCEEEGHEVTEKDIVRGFQYAKGEYVVLTPEDLKKVNAEQSRAISFNAFVPETEIPLLYYNQPYYLEPGKGAGRAYALLREALNESGRVGIVKYAFRTRENLGVVKPDGDGLVLIQIRYPDEIRAADLNYPETKVDKKELGLALQLIDSLSTDFKPKDYHDNYRQELDKIIEEKLSGKVTTAAIKEPTPTKVIDLMAALKKSIETKGKEAPAKKAKPKKTTASKRRHKAS